MFLLMNYTFQTEMFYDLIDNQKKKILDASSTNEYFSFISTIWDKYEIQQRPKTSRQNKKN